MSRPVPCRHECPTSHSPLKEGHPFMSTFWSKQRNDRARQSSDLEDTLLLPPLPVQQPYSNDRGKYRPRRAQTIRGFNTHEWDRNPGPRRRVGAGFDSRVAL